MLLCKAYIFSLWCVLKTLSLVFYMRLNKIKTLILCLVLVWKSKHIQYSLFNYAERIWIRDWLGVLSVYACTGSSTFARGNFMRAVHDHIMSFAYTLPYSGCYKQSWINIFIKFIAFILMEYTRQRLKGNLKCTQQRHIVTAFCGGLCLIHKVSKEMRGSVVTHGIYFFLRTFLFLNVFSYTVRRGIGFYRGYKL